MLFMLTKIKQFVKIHQSDIILLIGVILISLLSFAIGYIVAKEQEKEPLRIEREAVYEFTNRASRYELVRIIYLYIRNNS